MNYGFILKPDGLLKRLLEEYPLSRIILECGMQSPGISRFLAEVGTEVIVANPSDQILAITL